MDGTCLVSCADILRKENRDVDITSVVVLTQISPYTTRHKNLAVHKIMEAMHTAYTKKRDLVSTRLKQNKTQMIMEHTRVCEREACIVCEEHFNSLNC